MARVGAWPGLGVRDAWLVRGGVGQGGDRDAWLWRGGVGPSLCSQRFATHEKTCHVTEISSRLLVPIATRSKWR